MAKSMICGFCSVEQPIKDACTKCGKCLVKESKANSFWEGGKGCRSKVSMSNKDSHKFIGVNKTISRKKKKPESKP